MFTGYHGRRRLKTLLYSLTIAGSFIIIIICHKNASLINQYLNRFLQRRTNIVNDQPKLISSRPEVIKAPENVSLSSAPTKKAKKGVLSAIEFFNSETLILDFDSSKIIPILVLSNASNIEIRDAVRRTWGFKQTYGKDMVPYKVFFLVGVEDFVERRIHAEQIIFGDVIQVSLPDIYSYFAYKELSAMVWVKTFLPQARYYIKTEDNTFMNMKIINNVLMPIIENSTNNQTILGWFNSEPILPRGSYQKLVNAILPPQEIELYYALSLFYVITTKAIDSMLEALSHIDFIEHPGDPFVTGVLRDAAHVQRKDFSIYIGHFRYELKDGACRQSIETNPYLLFCAVSEDIRITRSVQEYFDAWNMLTELQID